MVQGWEPGSQEEAPKQGFQAGFPGTGSQIRFPTGSQEQVPKQGFPGKGSQQEVPKQGFPGRGSQARFSGRGSQARVPRKRFPGTGFQARFPGTGFASTDFRNRFQGFQEPFPKQDFQEHVFPKQNEALRTGFQASVSRKGFAGSKVPSKLVPKQCFQEEVRKPPPGCPCRQREIEELEKSDFAGVQVQFDHLKVS